MAEPPKAGAGKKFSITIQVPEDLTAQWPNRATAEKLVQEVYTAMGSMSAAHEAPAKPMAVTPATTPRSTRRGMAMVVAAALVAGGVGGYLGARVYLGPMAERSAATAPARSEPAPTTAAPLQPTPADTSAASNSPAVQTPTAQPADETATSKPVAPVTQAYNVQVGAYRVRENAEVFLQRLQQDGFQAQIVRSSGLYVVQFGPFQTLQEAGRLVEKLKGHQYDAVVIRITSAGH